MICQEVTMSHSDDIVQVIDELRQLVVDGDMLLEIEDPKGSFGSGFRKQFSSHERHQADLIFTIARTPMGGELTKLKIVCLKDRQGRFEE